MGYALSIGRAPREAARIGLAVLTGQLAIGWQNDSLDAARDREAGRLDKPIVAGEVPAPLVGLAAGAAALSCVAASLANGRRAGLTHLLALASAASYNLGLKSTVASFAPYGLSFSLLPAFASLSGEQERRPALWACAAAGTLGLAAHLLNVLPDRGLDRALGVYGLPQRLSPTTDLALGGTLLALSSALIALGPRRLDAAALLGLTSSLALGAAVIHAAASGHERRAFRLVLALALLDVRAPRRLPAPTEGLRGQLQHNPARPAGAAGQRGASARLEQRREEVAEALEPTQHLCRPEAQLPAVSCGHLLHLLPGRGVETLGEGQARRE